MWKKEPTRSKRSVPDSEALWIADKYAQASDGDLVIGNLTMEDAGTYTAVDKDTNTVLASFKINVTDGGRKWLAGILL